MTETIVKKIFDMYFDFLVLAHVRFTNKEEAGSMTYTAARQQGAMKRLWLHFWVAVMSSVFVYSL